MSVAAPRPSILATATRCNVYTDGGCKPNPGIGGWGAVFYVGEKRETRCGGAPDTTNNRMELTAALEALRCLPPTCATVIRTDSVYLQKGMSLWRFKWKRARWMKKSGDMIPNHDLWIALDSIVDGRDVQWKWIKGHGSNKANHHADLLAGQAREAFRAGMKEVARNL